MELTLSRDTILAIGTVLYPQICIPRPHPVIEWAVHREATLPGAKSHLHVSHIQTGHIHDLTAHHTPTYMRKKVCSATVAWPFLELFPSGAAGRERNCLQEQKGERQGFLVQSIRL